MPLFKVFPSIHCSKSPLKVILEESSRQDLGLIPKSGRRGMIAKSAWNSMRIKNDQEVETAKISKEISYFIVIVNYDNLNYHRALYSIIHKHCLVI